MMRSGEFECVFRYFDEDCDGKISARELSNRVGMMMVVGEEEAEMVIKSLDSDGDGLLDMEDFVGLMEGGGGGGGDDDDEEKLKDLREAFGMYIDREDECECITPKSLKRMLSRLAESRSIDECGVMINRFDLNGDGVLSFLEFREMMMH